MGPVFLSVTLDFYSSEDAVHSKGMPVGSTPKGSFIVSLRATDLVSLTNEVWLSKKLNLAYGVSLNISSNRTIAVHGVQARRHFVLAVEILRT